MFSWYHLLAGELLLTFKQEIMLDLSMRQSLRVHKALGMKL
jgi:hypothetical protein